MSRRARSARCLCLTSDYTRAPHPPLTPSTGARERMRGADAYCDALPRRSLRGSLSAVYAAPQTLDTTRIFIPSSSMHIHGKVDGAGARVRVSVCVCWGGWVAGWGGGCYMSSQCSAECRSRRRMLIQLYGSCSLVPVATVFALEQRSCISCLAIKGHCQARERRLPAPSALLGGAFLNAYFCRSAYRD